MLCLFDAKFDLLIVIEGMIVKEEIKMVESFSDFMTTTTTKIGVPGSIE